MSRQDYNDSCVARNAHPNTNEVRNPFDRSGKRNAWTKTHQMACPHCGAEFFGYEPADRPFPPYELYPASDGRLPTCGHPFCVKAEDDRAIKGSSEYRAAQEKAFNPERNQEPEKPSRRGGGLGRLIA